MENLSRLRSEHLFTQALQTGSLVVVVTIVMFFVVLAFRKESITVPALFKWAVALLGASLLLPVLAVLISITGSMSGNPSSRGSEFKGLFMILATAASPLLYFSSITLALFAMLPWGRQVTSTVPPSQPRPSTPSSVTPPTAEKFPEKHPLD